MMIPSIETLQTSLGMPSLEALLIVLVGAAAFAVIFLSRIWNSQEEAELRKQYELSLRVLDNMIAQDPTDAMSIWRKGQAHEALGMPERALRYYRAAHYACPRAYGARDVVEARERLMAGGKNDLMRV